MANRYTYVVKQYQPSDGYNGDPIYVYTREEDAITAVRNLNKTYGVGCIFDEDGDLLEVLEEDYPHYYTYESILLNDHIPQEEKICESYVIEIKSNIGYIRHVGFVGKDDMKTEDINNAKTFYTWDDAHAMITVLEKLGLYTDYHLIIGRIN